MVTLPQVGNALQQSYPLLLSMAQGLQSGQGSLAYMNHGLAGMMSLQEKKQAELEKAKEAAAKEEAGNMVSGYLGSMMGGQPTRDTRNAALAAGGGPTRTAATNMNRDTFIQQMMPHAMRVSQQTGIDPRLVIAQAAQETGWGQHAPNNNYFGIKSHGKGGGSTLSTKEYVNGQPVTVNDSFRGYGGMGESADDYASFLMSNPRYGDMLNAQGLDAQVAALGQSGYATDPNYANSVGSIARSINLPETPNTPRISPERAAAIIQSPHVSSQVKEMVLAQFQPQKPVDRKVIKGADGFNYYQDTGERVLPNVTAPEAPPADEYGRYAAEEAAAGRTPLSRIDYAQAKKGQGVSVTGPDGTQIQIGGSAGTTPKLTVDAAKNSGFYLRTQEANEVLNELEGQGTDFRQQNLEHVPLGAGNYFRSPEFQKFDQARRDFVNAILRRESGAVISDQEFDNANKQYFPVPGDSPEVIAQKRRNRETAIEGLRIGSGEGAAFVDNQQPQDQPQDFSTMSADEVMNVDINQLSDADVSALLKRMEDLGL